MTIRLPSDNIFDRILTIFGKKRGIILPSTQAESFRNGTSPYVTLKAKKESFLKAFTAATGVQIPLGTPLKSNTR